MQRRTMVVSVAMVMSGLLVACGGSDTTEPSGSGSTSAPASGELTISGSAFSPSSVVAGEGGALTVTNEDGISHTFTMDDGSVDEAISGGASVSVTVTAAGPFHCAIHSSMTGTVSLG